MFVIYLLNVFKNSFVIMKYKTISLRKLPLALQFLTREITFVAFSNYDNEYRMLKKVLVGHLLNINI
jgi:hypothetical protein